MKEPGTTKYPRRGEPIVPRALLPLVLDRHQAFPPDRDSELFGRFDLGPGAWERLSPEICERLALRVVDRVQTRLESLPPPLRDVRLPDPRAALELPLERRTANTLRRALAREPGGEPWTVGRYVALPRFGGRALVDLMAASEGRAPISPGLARYGLADPVGNVDDVLVALARELPIAEQRATSNLLSEGLITRPLQLSQLFRLASQLGRPIPFRVIELGGSRVVVRLSDVTMARNAYRIASRAIQGRGAVTVAAITEQVRAAAHAEVTQTFVERLLAGLTAFRWLAHPGGWFWFVKRPNRLLANLRKIFSVTRSVPLDQLSASLSRPHPVPLPDEAIAKICGELPGVHVIGGAATIDRPLPRAQCLDAREAQIVELLERSGGCLPDGELRWQARSVGLPAGPVWRLLQSSPLFYQCPGGLFRLVGST